MKKRWIVRVIIVVFVLAAAAEAVWFLAPDLFQARLPEGFIRASGRIEGRTVEVSSRIPGRVVELLADEGQELAAGDVVARISSDELTAHRRGAEANLALWSNRRRQAELDLNLTRRRIESSVSQAEAVLAAAEANLGWAAAAAEQAELDYARYRGLAADGVVPQVQLERAELLHVSARNEAEAARQAVRQAQLNLVLAEELRLTIDLKREAVAEAERMIEAAQAELEAVEARLADTVITAPISGVVLERVVEPQEVVSPGTPILTMVSPDDLYLKIYVPNVEMGRLRIGNPARITPDAFPDERFEAQVTRISERSEFTPKNVETREQRINLVFEVKLGRIDNAERRLRPGMTAEAVVKYDDSIAWHSAGS